MIVNDTIKLCCDFVNLPELKDLVGTGNGDDIQKAKLNAMLRCLNLAYEEICTEADTCLNIIAYNISAYAFDFV